MRPVRPSLVRMVALFAVWLAVALLCYIGTSNGFIDTGGMRDGHRPDPPSLIPLTQGPPWPVSLAIRVAVEPGRWLLLRYFTPFLDQLADRNSAELFFRVFSFANAAVWVGVIFVGARLAQYLRRASRPATSQPPGA
jgi:hypothetical protein